jgi:hypothetical protein
MQQRWDGWLTRTERELPIARAAAEAYQRGREDAARATATAPRSTTTAGTDAPTESLTPTETVRPDRRT